MIGGIAVLLACLPILMSRSSDAGLLRDTDTAVLLQTIRERSAPLSWFAGDWPLGNHFYRPVSTLSFELDNALYGSNAAGYGLTNALVCIACVLLLFWFLRELTDRIEIAAPAAVIFALWHVNGLGWLEPALYWFGVAALLAMLLPGRSWKPPILAALTLIFVGEELSALVPLQTRMIAWLPGRTASVMSLFALLSLAAYARYERTSSHRDPPPEPGPLDPPATKGTALRPAPSRTAWAWGLLSVIALALAFGSYEQAVMVPALLFGAACCLRLQRLRVRWAWQAAFWGLLGGYLVLRNVLVPSDVSGYQAQQFRSGPGVWTSLLDYFVPSASLLWQGFLVYDPSFMFAEGGVYGLVATFPFRATLGVASTLGAATAAARSWLLPFTGWMLSGLAFLPMAWLKHFDHYHYLPMALRAFFVSAMLGVAGRALVSAVSRPAIQAPPRRDPAPGSLPRP
jgi:hypothetical protein